MADVAITASGVLQGANAVVNPIATFGATDTQGQVVYMDVNGVWQLAQATTLIGAGLPGKVGILLNAGSVGQAATVQTSGQITVGGTLVFGTTYVISAAVAGHMAPETDLLTGNYITILGVAISTTVLQLSPIVTGGTHV